MRGGGEGRRRQGTRTCEKGGEERGGEGRGGERSRGRARQGAGGGGERRDKARGGEARGGEARGGDSGEGAGLIYLVLGNQLWYTCMYCGSTGTIALAFIIVVVRSSLSVLSLDHPSVVIVALLTIATVSGH